MFDLQIRNATVITLDPKNRVIRNGAIGIERNRIVAIGPTSELDGFGSVETIEANENIVVPGLINSHTHLFQTFSRGLGDDAPLFEWFRRAIAPFAAHLTEEDCYYSAILGCIEAIKSGTTCVNDFMYVHPRARLSDAIVKAMNDVGIRGILCRGIVDAGREHGLPDAIIQERKIAIEDCERLIVQYNNPTQDMIRVWVAPASLWMSSIEAFKESKKLADEYHTWITWHASETQAVVDSSIRKYGSRDTTLLNENGLLSDKAVAVHSVWLDDREISMLAKNGTKVAHCPVANMYLADGIAPIPKMLEHGIPVGLGTDGSAGNNNLDMIAVMKTAALLQKVFSLDPTIITAPEVMRMATLDGARTLGLENKIGSIEVGKKADLVLINLKKPNTIPTYNPISSIVYAANQENVESVIIDGKVVMRNRKMLAVDETDIMEKASQLAHSLSEKSVRSV